MKPWIRNADPDARVDFKAVDRMTRRKSKRVRRAVVEITYQALKRCFLWDLRSRDLK